MTAPISERLLRPSGNTLDLCGRRQLLCANAGRTVQAQCLEPFVVRATLAHAAGRRAEGFVRRGRHEMSGASTPPPPPPPIPDGSPHASGSWPVAPWYWRTWVVVLACIFVFPVGLALLWTRKPQWSSRGRWIASAAVVALAAISIVSVATAPPQTTAPTAAAQTPLPVGGAEPSATPLVTPPAATLATPSATPTPIPTLAPTSVPTAAQADLCGAPQNPWGYNFCGGGLIYAPDPSFCDYFNCIPSFWRSTNGYVVQCNDGLFSHSGGRRGACSSHGGEGRSLYS